MVAVDAEKNLIIVKELLSPSIWTSFWKKYMKGQKSYTIDLNKDASEDACSISWLGDQLIQGLNYIMAKRYVLLGILSMDNQIQDPQILEDWGFFKRRKKYFTDLLTNYRELYHEYPTIGEDNSVNIEFIGVGEKFFSISHLNLAQVAQMSSYFSGNLHGLVSLKEKKIDMMIISQNINKQHQSPPLVMDKKGRDTVINLIKRKEIIPVAGFQFHYGSDALHHISCGDTNLWDSMELLPKYAKPMKLYEKYLDALKFDKASPIEHINFPSPFSTIIGANYKEKKKRLSPEDLFREDSKRTTPESPNISENLKFPQKVELKKPNLQPAKIKLSPINLSKDKIQSQESSISTEDQSIDYEDVFDQSTPKVQLFDDDGKIVIDPSQIDKVLENYTPDYTEEKITEVKLEKMSKDDIFKDLEASLKALSQLDNLALEDHATSRIYYPPLSLISKASKEGMTIGGSTVILSMGTGRNLWMVPEIKCTQMWGKFYEDSDLSDQFEDFVALREKDIESSEELENLLQNAFIRIRSNNHMFLGLCDFEGNGFERNVFDPELMLDSVDISKLMEIHQQKREKMHFPELESEQWIEVRYFGKPEIIKLFKNPKTSSILEIAHETSNNPIYRIGNISGIVCLDEEAAYFFILSDNFKSIHSGTENEYNVDNETLQKMYRLIEEMDLTPASWWRLTLGFQSFESLFQWDDIKDGIIFPIIKENYVKYISNLIKTKEQEDLIRKTAEERFPNT